MLEIGDRWEGAISDGEAVVVTIASARSLTQIAGWAGFGAHASGLLGRLGLAFPATYDRAATANGLRVWRIAPDRLLLQSQEPSRLDRTPDLAVLDLSHAKIAVTLAGPGAAGLLARVAAIDFSQDAFPTGRFVQTAIHAVGVLIERTAPDAFELFVPVSWSQSVVEFLTGHLLMTEAVH